MLNCVTTRPATTSMVDRHLLITYCQLCNHTQTTQTLHFFTIFTQVELLGFPAHTTHILQPLDVGVFGPLKEKYRSLCITAGRASTRCKITRSLFPTTWHNCLTQVVTPSVVKSAFRRTGIWPFDPTAIDLSKVKRTR